MYDLANREGEGGEYWFGCCSVLDDPNDDIRCRVLGFARATRLVPRDTPRLGRTLEVALLDLPANSAFVVFGWSNTAIGSVPLPIDLGSLGMPGCRAQVSPDVVLLVVGTAGEGILSIAVPRQPALLGAAFYNQALIPDPGTNPFGAVVSDAAMGRIGD